MVEIEKVLHMNGGDGNTSYAINSLLQRTVASMVKPILEEGIEQLYITLLPECLKMADLGCSTGFNTLSVVSDVLEIIGTKSKMLNLPPPSLQAFLNDLPGNDFNTIFRSLPSFYTKLENEKGSSFGHCFITTVAGSFYVRLFPSNSLHFVHSSYVLMWLSMVPKQLVCETQEALNKGNICIAKTSPPAVVDAYLKQFEKDFTMFLKCRAEELVPGGRMVLTILGSIKSDDPLSIWEVVGLKLNDMVLEGLIESEKLDNFNLPWFAPTSEEVKKVIEVEGSFTLHKCEVFKMDWDSYIKKANIGLERQGRAAKIATDLRAVGEPILSSQFGEEAMDDLFQRFKAVVLDHMEAEKCEHINLVISLTKKG
ncbi:S-adenosyl-L-methionine:benzoic acid/salicylic acid carboxyl methyltransferase 3 [Quercus suber]|uniref:S-adenosyl-L-methionine:benzoic acid/salicylic acid carboxyl methyltransferase 3 n=1 Tax=Quercus suber TaxID=58331 RepID=UPI000CE1B457|nr:salicylate carboxymethyltransferase-like [Quercus suber]XP_023929817.1 salicylate carboxymethyltransferase-like [Quercus suber]